MTAEAAMSSSGVALLAFFGVAVVFLFGVWLLVSNSARRSALAERGGVEIPRHRRVDELLESRVSRTERGAILSERLRAAGSERSAGQFLLIVAGVGVGVLLVVHLLFPLLLAIAATVVAVWGCFAWLQRRLDRRKEEFIGQLPEVARLLSNGASAGLSMPAALELTVREIEAPARDELQKVVEELQLGRSMADSLESLQRRLPSREISVLMTTLIIQQRAGGDVVHALQELSETLDSRRQTLREVTTLLAGAVYTSYLVPVLGLGALLLLNAINSRVLKEMTSKPAGIIALIVASMLYAVGWVAIRRTTKVEL
ncbi:MAG: type II secretion system F family protein [Solirubrobacteraceae bacterium]